MSIETSLLLFREDIRLSTLSFRRVLRCLEQLYKPSQGSKNKIPKTFNREFFREVSNSPQLSEDDVAELASSEFDVLRQSVTRRARQNVSEILWIYLKYPSGKEQERRGKTWRVNESLVHHIQPEKSYLFLLELHSCQRQSGVERNLQ